MCNQTKYKKLNTHRAMQSHIYGWLGTNLLILLNQILVTHQATDC